MFLKKIFFQQSETIPRAASVLSIASFFSVVLGLLRDRLLAARFGAGCQLDAYYAAFRLPDFINMVLITGAISAAIIPIFSQYWISDKEKAKHFLGNLVNVIFLAIGLLGLIGFFLAGWLVNFIAPGFSPVQKSLTVSLTRLMLLSPFLLGLSNVVSSVLQVFSRFLITALAPILYNAGIIIGIIFFAPYFGIIGAGLGVVLGAFLHLALQLPLFFKLGFGFHKGLNLADPGLKKAIKLTLPRSLGLAAGQFNLVVMTALASYLSAGSLAIFSFANNLRAAPIIFLAIPFATAAFPRLSLSSARSSQNDFIQSLGLSFRLLFFLIIPSTVFLFFARQPIIGLFLQSGRFSAQDTQLTAACLALFALGLFAYGSIILLAKAFYALKNSLLPAFVALISVCLNLGLCFLFIYLFKNYFGFSQFFSQFFQIGQTVQPAILGLPLAFSLSGICQFFLLYYFLRKKISQPLLGLKKTVLKTILSAGFLSICLMFFFDSVPAWSFLYQCIGGAIIAFFAFALAAFLLRSQEIYLLKRFLKQKIAKPSYRISDNSQLTP